MPPVDYLILYMCLAQNGMLARRSHSTLCKGLLAPSSELENEPGMPLSCIEQNIEDISLNRAQHLSFALRGRTWARLSKYYVQYGSGGSSWRLGWTGLNGKLGSDDSRMWDNKAAHRRVEMDAVLCGGLPIHVDNTVYKDEKEGGGGEQRD